MAVRNTAIMKGESVAVTRPRPSLVCAAFPVLPPWAHVRPGVPTLPPSLQSVTAPPHSPPNPQTRKPASPSLPPPYPVPLTPPYPRFPSLHSTSSARHLSCAANPPVGLPSVLTRLLPIPFLTLSQEPHFPFVHSIPKHFQSEAERHAHDKMVHAHVARHGAHHGALHHHGGGGHPHGTRAERDSARLWGDHLHLTPHGYDKLGQLVYDTLKDELKAAAEAKAG